MKIKIYPIKSILHNGLVLEHTSQALLDEIANNGDFEFELIEDFSNIDKEDIVLIFVQSGGSENKFLKEIYPYYKGPYYLLTYKTNNSFAASLEILSFIRQQSLYGEILHGDAKYIASRLNELNKANNKEIVRLGVLDTPSDWLISSNVIYNKVLDRFGIELVNIKGEELDKYVTEHINQEKELDKTHLFDQVTLFKSQGIYEGIKQLLDDNNLSGFTIRCFDVLLKTKQSACFALAKLNSEGYLGCCEGDIPALISMEIVRRLFNLPTFQANPQELDLNTNTISLAHCTIPFNMVKDYNYHTHFESNMGLGIEGKVYEGEATLFKIGANLDEFYCVEGKLIQDSFSDNRCRTQVKMILEDDLNYFLKSSLGNHHLIIYGRRRKGIRNYLLNLGLKEIR